MAQTARRGVRDFPKQTHARRGTACYKRLSASLTKELQVTNPIYNATVPVYTPMLSALSKIIDKLEAHCEAKKIDPVVFANTRLFPDMFDFKRQVQMAADFAKNPAARLAGLEPPAFADTETTLPELKARIAKTLDYLKSLKPEQFKDAATREITITPGGQKMTFPGEVYLNNFALPNFYFHLTSAYAILRANGLDIGKWDYMGR
jgi:hypothetical protein